MNWGAWRSRWAGCPLGVWIVVLMSGMIAADEPRGVTFSVTVDRGADVGQSFGSLFEAVSEDGTLVVGAGFQNLYNTRLRGDRHAVQFFVRPTGGERSFRVEELPRPNNLCGTYLSGRDEVVRSTFGGLKAWDAAEKTWRPEPEVGGTQEVMRLGAGLLEFGDSLVKFNGRTILSPPKRGTYQNFFYANGHLCFYRVERGDRGYRPFESDADGFSKLYACPWTPALPEVALSKAIVFRLPVVGEMTFAWGQLGRQIITGSNIGGFYILEDGRWRKLLEPNLKVSYQLYSTLAFYDRLLMGQYPTGRLFDFDGRAVTDLTGWPPVPPGVSSSAREAQTTAIYGGELLAGVWPWGELWRFNPDSRQWRLMRRMFDHPPTSAAVVHPYDVENRGHPVPNQWGQRVASLVTSGDSLFVSTSAKDPCVWNPEQNPFLAPEKWKSFGAVYRLTMPGHLGAATAWTDGPTKLELTIQDGRMRIAQDGKPLATTTINGPLGDKLRGLTKLKPIRWGEGIYGKFSGEKLEGKCVVDPPSAAGTERQPGGKTIVTVARSTREYPRKSEGDVIELNDRRLLLVYMEFTGTGSDFAQTRLVAQESSDGGLTWGRHRVITETTPGDVNVYSPNLIRAKDGGILLMFMRQHRPGSLTNHMWKSSDEGRTFAPRAEFVANRDFALCNATVKRLASGRLLVPASPPLPGKTAERGPYCAAMLFSDDDGLTWRVSESRVELPMRGAMEPHVEQTADGRVLMVMRNQLGKLYLSESKDDGATWSAPHATELTSPESCPELTRIPGTTDLLMIWNNTFDPRFTSHYGKRSPLTAAISKDHGKTWRHVRDIETDPHRAFSNPGCRFTKQGQAIINYWTCEYLTNWAMQDVIDLRVAVIDKAWFYSPAPTGAEPRE